MILIILWRLTHKFILERWRDLLCVIKNFIYKYVMKKETLRLANLLNWRIRKDFKKSEFPYSKVKIKSVDEEKTVNVSHFKKSPVLVLRQQIKGNSESENLARITSSAVIYGLLAHTRRYISPELSTALNNVEIIRQLREMKDYVAEDLFIKSMNKSDPIIETNMQKLFDLNAEGVYKNIFLPYLGIIDKHIPTNEDKAKNDSNYFFDWIADWEKRLVNALDSRHFLKTKFVYVRNPEIPIDRHIIRAITNFNDLNCNVVVIMGWEPFEKSVDEVSVSLRKMGYPLYKRFKGYCPKLNKRAFLAIHQKNKEIFVF